MNVKKRLRIALVLLCVGLVALFFALRLIIVGELNLGEGLWEYIIAFNMLCLVVSQSITIRHYLKQ